MATAKAKTLAQVNKEIKERQEYLETQEKLISDAITKGNDQLRDLESEFTNLVNDKNRLENKILQLNEELELKQAEISQAVVQKQRLDEVYQTAAGQYKEKLSEITDKVNQAIEDFAVMQDKITAWRTEKETGDKELNARRAELDIREKALYDKYRVEEQSKSLV